MEHRNHRYGKGKEAYTVLPLRLVLNFLLNCGSVSYYLDLSDPSAKSE